MPDRTSEPAEGERRTYALPNQYGPARPPKRGDDPDDLEHFDDFGDPTPAVVLRGPGEPTSPAVDQGVDPPISINGQATAENDLPAAASETATVLVAPDPDTVTSAPRSRREIREHRERERVAAKKEGKPTRSPRKKWTRRVIAIVVVLLLVPVAISYAHAVQRPGSDTLSVKTVEWLRDHGGNGIVNTVERWWYTNNPPPVGGKPSAIKVQGTIGEPTTKPNPSVTTTTLPQIQRIPPPTARVPTPASVVEVNEGVWQPTGRLVLGQPAAYTTYVRPDAVHTSYYTALMWLDTKLLRANYVVGLEQPGGGPNPWGSQIPESQRDEAIAAFNSGFKMDTARGGAYLDGNEIVHLVNGAASLVIFQDGSATVGVWGRDVVMSPNVKAVRQNLEPIVDNGQLNPAMQENDTNAFGATLGNNVYVWRSGVGVTADGALIYAGGPAMSIVSLARTLQAAGAVRAMELDINSDWVSAFTYGPQDPAAFGSPIVGTKLLDSMSHGGSQYLQQSSRDFFAFTADPKLVAPVPTTTPATTTTTKPKKN
ncbi:MAG: phosphodiester glycosidase family protein [Acidimicrobiia bacterium]